MTPRQIAEQKGDKTYEGKPCKEGHTTKLISGECVVCKYDKVKAKKYRDTNKEKISIKNKKYRDNNTPQSVLDRKKQVKEANINYLKAVGNNDPYFEGMPCRKHGHTIRYANKSKNCVECRKQSQKQWRDNNKEKSAINQKKWRDNNKEKVAINQKKYRDNNKEKISIHNKKYYESHPKSEGDKEKDCFKQGVKGYPTIMIYQNNKAITYDGERTSSALINYCNKL